MKYIILFFIMLFTLPGFGQQDSITYEKAKNGGNTNLSFLLSKSDLYAADSIYYKFVFAKSGEKITITIEPFTDKDSLMGNVLYSEFTDASRQYKQALLISEEQEKGYLLRLRQAERQYKRFTGEEIKTKVESNFDFTELLGDWLLNGKAVKIDGKLEIDKQPIKILSDQQFTALLDKEQRVFNRVKAGKWVAKDGKYILERPKEKSKNRGK